jgi:hypothetical protein
VKKTLSAVLVNYNSGAELRRALESIDREAAGSGDVIVVDNASTDGSERTVADFASARLIRNQQNVGFGRAVNQGVAVCTAERILIMNPDCQLMAGALPPLMAALDADPRCAIAAPRILNPDGSAQGNARGDPNMLTGLFGRTSRLRRSLSELEVARRNVVSAEASGNVDWVSGACMLVRRESLAAVGGFDERYFMYWEDADLCRRLRARGYTIRYVPESTAIHQVGQSSRTARTSSIRAFHSSAYLYYATHVAPGALNPKRWIAHALLGARCWWKLRS